MQRSKKQDLKRPSVGIKHEFIAAGHNIQFTSDSIIRVETCLRSTEGTPCTMIKIYIYKVTILNNEMVIHGLFQ